MYDDPFATLGDIAEKREREQGKQPPPHCQSRVKSAITRLFLLPCYGSVRAQLKGASQYFNWHNNTSQPFYSRICGLWSDGLRCKYCFIALCCQQPFIIGL